MNNKDLIRQYVDTGLELPEYQVNRLNGNVLQTYLRKRLIADGEKFKLQDFEVARMNDEQRHKYENDRYANIEAIITRKGVLNRSMFEKMNNNQINRYMKNRIDSNDELTRYERNFLTDEQRLNYIENMINSGNDLTFSDLEKATDEQKYRYIEHMSRSYMVDYEFRVATDDQKYRYINKRKSAHNSISDEQQEWLNNYLKNKRPT